MKRTEKLYTALADLESQFLEMATEEFEDRYGSRYLSRKIPHIVDGKKWRNARTATIERLEKDILALRAKLNEPLTEGPVSVVYEFIKAREAAKDRYDGGIERLQREAFTKLKKMKLSTTSA